MFGSGTTALLIYNGKMNDIIKIVRYLEVSGLLIKGVIETFKNKAKNKTEGFSVCY